MKYVKIYDDKMRQTGLADIEQNYDKSGYVKVFDKDMQPIGVMDVDSIPEAGANLPFVKVYDANLVMTGVVSVDNIRHSDGYLIKLQKDPSTTGSVSGGGRFVSGTSVTVVATPDAQSEYTEFDGWYEGDTKVSENASYTFTVSGARTLVAKFAIPTPTVPEFTLDFEFPIGVTGLGGKTMTVNNGVSISASDCVEHLKFTDSEQNKYGVVDDGGTYKIGSGDDKFNSLTVASNTITFGEYSAESPIFASYSWE